MSIPRTFAPVSTQDFTLRAVDLYRRYHFSSSYFDTTASGYFFEEGWYRRDPTPIGSSLAQNDPVNSSNGSYKHIVWKSIDHRYYRFPYDAYASLEHHNPMLTTKQLFQTASILTAPYFDFGIGVKPGSTTISNTTYGISCYEDIYGNLRIAGYDTASFANGTSVAGYWGFNELFRKFKYNTGLLTSGEATYHSANHSVDTPSIYHNVRIDQGVPVAGTASGLCATFEGDGYVLATSRDEFNFSDSVDFTISAWVNCPPSQSVTSKPVNDIVSKNGVVFKTTYGAQESQRIDGTVIVNKHYSSSYHDQSVPIFPLGLQVYNQTGANSGKILFQASNGVQTVSLTSTSTVNDGVFHHVAVTKSGSLYTLYIDGVSEATSTFDLRYCANECSVMFGSKNRQFAQAFSGSLDEVRFYEYAVTPAQVTALADNTTGRLYQTDVIGNVFNRRGVFVVSSLIPAYQNMMMGGWNLTFKGTHTVYQYEALCRIRKGDFNLSLNPSARVHPKSDRLIDDFTGSLLRPYATTVGLYNDRHELVAVARLGAPLKMREDVDINILVKWEG